MFFNKTFSVLFSTFDILPTNFTAAVLPAKLGLKLSSPVQISAIQSLS